MRDREAGAAAPRATRRALFGWVMFDWAQQPFYTLVTTFLFAPYFANVFVGDPVRGQALWGYGAAAAGLIVAVTSPLMGAMADQTGRRKPWVAGLSVLLVVMTGALWMAIPGAGHLVLPVIIAFVLATVAAEGSVVFTNAMMCDLVGPDRLGRLSGIGWAVGYVGGIASLLIVAGLIVTGPDGGATLLGLEPIIELDTASRQGDRLVGPFTALWYLIFVIPFFIFTPDRARRRRRANLAQGLRTLRETLSQVRAYRNVVTFLLARMLFIDGLGAIFAFGGIYGAAIFSWRGSELGVFGIVLTIAGAIGAFFGGRLDDRLGAKPVMIGALLGLIAAAFAIISIDERHILYWIEVRAPEPHDGLFASTPERVYLALAVLIGLVAGPLQASSRSLMARISPPERITQFFGLFAFSGKITSFIAPLLVGLVTTWSQSQRLGIATTVLFLAAGLALLTRVET